MNRPAPRDALPAPSISLRGVTRSFGARRVLDDVTLERSGPGVVGLVGPNGSGKTTLLRICAQLLEPDAGDVQVAGFDVQRADCAPARATVGWMPHAPLAWMDDSVVRNLRYGARLGGCSRREAQGLADEAVERWGLADVANDPVRRLSRGWQGRYALARADLFHPAVLLLDEPTTGLDDAARATLDAALEQWRGQRLVLVSSHERSWLDPRCDVLLALGVPVAAPEAGAS